MTFEDYWNELCKETSKNPNAAAKLALKDYCANSFAAGAASRDPEIAIADAYRCGAASRDAEIAELAAALEKASEEIRRCDYTPARSTLLVALAKVRKP